MRGVSERWRGARMILSPRLPRAQSLPTASEGAALPRAWLAAGGGEGWGDASCSRGQGGWSAALLELAERAAGAQLAMGGLKEELLKTIWHAFTALDLDRSGKVSKSQLKVLSHNLCTVLNVPHDPVALEEHFRDDDEGPVSNQGYMPYLNKFILEKVQGNFDKVEFNRMCWTLCFKKNLTKSPLFISDEDAFKVWVIFNFLSEDKYPLVIVPEEGYMLKKGHRRKNWTERWFVLKPNIISYYASEDLKDKKGDIILDENCFVESLPDKDGKKCLFLIKCLDKSFEISASDKKKKQEWIQAIQTTVNLLRVGSPPPHKEARQKRKELRQKLQAEQEELERQMKELQIANENKQEELETVRKQLEEAAARAAVEEKKRLQTQMELQDRFSVELAREKMVRQQMEEQVAQKSSELKQYLQRVCELEEMYKKLQEALEDEKQARQDEETVRKLQARLLEEESAKRAELEKWHLQQQQTILMTEAEKQELETQRIIKERALQVAMQQLEQLELERKQALEQYEGVKKKLELAANKTKSWKDKVAHHEGLIRLIEPGAYSVHKIQINRAHCAFLMRSRKNVALLPDLPRAAFPFTSSGITAACKYHILK
uniref:Switch-associated protein 70 n=1 Tax=Chrysemys picta bellii TaxID=8478 RepID=A0A8C3IHK5_CHRPI